jgi:4-alpha-glucanotransferase
MHGKIDAYTMRDFLSGQQLNYPKPLYYSLMNLMGSHDVERLRTALATDIEIGKLSRAEQMHLYFSPEALDLAIRREMLCAAIQFALPGVPSIYYGDEQGMCDIRDPFNRTPFKEGNPQLKEYYAALANMRNRADALSTGEACFQAAGADVLLILRYITDGRDVFGRPAENGAYLAVINRGEVPASYAEDCSAAGRGIIRGRMDACAAEIMVL